MITRSTALRARQRAAELIRQAHIFISPAEEEGLEVVDFGLSRFEIEGAAILTLAQTNRISVKLLALLPYQTEPEHWHPPVGEDPGKEETIRVAWGTLYFYVAGPDTLREGFVPPGKEIAYTVRHELALQPADTLTLQPGEKHWFQAGPQGAVIFSFSTIARDALDRFSDPAVVRATQICED